ncbi:nitroreductase family deazaflavin-dependent oxidoreductase [Nocardioides abyssi]|uniref:Nitroreductase family deazaflavin-dependent oxidoreductase n=1 Tax=Nocardioides abyssi TaxID=3058370 RepID=A0ABT8ENU2_9ACTN|nr:nitroreductase family deazaflavin-dependent oxidoreductase [Nocardioides abyssi]MDN4159823.1 nitroreductase family deazaflavin-dependent oxidoreductase [Nocardioides abyssi]
MGLLTPLAVRIGALPWMPRLLPQVVWVDKRLQQASRGRVSILDIAGLPNLTLTVPGRKSGVPRSTPLLCVPHEGGWLIAGSYFGDPKMPMWVRNLRATDPDGDAAIAAVGGRTRTVHWRELTDADRAAAWQVMLRTWPNYAVYEERTERTIPVFHLRPAP